METFGIYLAHGMHRYACENSTLIHGGVNGCQGGVNEGVSGALKGVNGGGKRRQQSIK
jgi:hypothetical protein